MGEHRSLPAVKSNTSYNALFLAAVFLIVGITWGWNASSASSPRTVYVIAIACVAVGVMLAVLGLNARLRRQAYGGYRVRYFRWGSFLFENIVTPKLIGIATGSIALYGGAQSFWGTTTWFVDYPLIHKWLKFTGLGLLFLIAVLSYLRERAKENNLKKTEFLLNKFTQLVGSIVQQKVVRFARKARELPSTRKFDHVAQPVEHLGVIFKEAADFLRDVFELDEDQIDFTVMERKDGGEWKYFIKYQLSRNHTPPTELFASNSCAKQALTTGNSVYIASKKLAAQEQNYHLSSHGADQDGSLYCTPVTVECVANKWEFLVSVVTYDSTFCDPHDEKANRKTEGLLREITRRIELELHLRAMKSPTSKAQ